MSTEIGVPVFGNTSERKSMTNANWRVVKGTTSTYRILPPFGLYAKIGKWFQYEAIHWGITGTNGKQKPFKCIQKMNYKTKMIEVECPMCSRIAAQNKLFDDRKAALEADKKTKDEVVALLQPLTDWFRRYNVQKGFFVNAMKQSGEIGRLFIKIKQKQNLDLEIEKLMKNKNPINPILATEGVYFEFSKHGLGSQTIFPVNVFKETVVVNGQEYETVKKAPLTDEVLARMTTEAFELANFYKEIPFNQIAMLASAEDDPTIADSVFGSPTMIPSTQTEDYEVPDEPEESTRTVTTKPSEAPDEEAMLLAQLAALKAKKETKTATPAPANVSTQTLGKEDFIAAFKAGKL